MIFSHRSITLFSLTVASVLIAQQMPSYKADPAFQKKWADAQTKERSRKERYFAADDYWSAFKVSNSQCVECLAGVMRVSLFLNDYKQVMKAADATESLAAADDKAKAAAKFMRATAMMRKDGEKPKGKTLAQVLPILQDAEKLDPANQKVRFQEGKVFAQLGRKEEASAEFREYLNIVPANDPLRRHVQKFVQKPELSLERMVPPFTLTTMDGKRFNLDALSGRVVLIDFWATWCGPCNAELPHIKRLVQEFKNDPFVMLSVSGDADTAAWEKFVAKNEMTWAQFHDVTKEMSRAFGVSSIPRYFTIDSDGTLQSVDIGSGSDIDGRLRQLIAKAKKDAASAQNRNAGGL